MFDQQDEYQYLVKLTENYLKDAGFSEELYKIITYTDTGFIEVVIEEAAIDYILIDIRKTLFVDLLRVTKYHNEDKTISAIFSLKNEMI